MALRFKTPEIKLERLKMLIYGTHGTGKSTMACQFPKTAYIDVEDLISKPKYQKLLKANNSQSLSISDFDEIINEVKSLMTDKHDYKTLVIDPFSVTWQRLVELMEAKHGDKYNKHMGFANKRAQQLIGLLLRLDMNIIIICQSKPERDATGTLKGETFVGYSQLGYLFDLVLETHVLGESFYAVVKKSRLEGFKTGEEIVFSYQDVIARCGYDLLERDVVPEILATPEQVASLNAKMMRLGFNEARKLKLLDYAKVVCVEDMPSSTITKCIDMLEKEILKIKEPEVNV